MMFTRLFSGGGDGYYLGITVFYSVLLGGRSIVYESLPGLITGLI